MKVKGKIVRGLEESGKFLSIPWVTEQIIEKLFFSPFLGTLNLLIEDKRLQGKLKEHARMKLESREKGFCDAILLKATINGQTTGGIVIPLVENYPANVLEIIAPVKLKESLDINDGDSVVVDIDI
ncbi:MAG: DUF120 domain-containing protein [Desulfobacteraceae bacterium]|nr:MAG: DUF120 domain-containing protein [Desulfobacteraceae bacterium]